MGSLWQETRKVELVPATETAAALVVTLQHIGDKDNPFAWDRMQSAWMREVEMMRIAVRKELIAQYGSADTAVETLLEGWKEKSFSRAVNYWMQQSDAYIDALSRRVKALISAGIIGGEALYHEIYKAGGVQLLNKASAEVVRFHEVSPSTGEV